ncbi:YtxH domain-containing protein [Streptococcus didelphis]|uniref:YtxH domain-containing protein n=1 Tax=Streptococcus didelphis TaxID=102886 RepID=A0ABY9LIA5_9STRE|nr:YtxH domain-containing protein [Streptococcus didelphis]WMB28453.1 YtxH domain-containing protein [Streptococcus didelphis]WMB29129.1 YtxH domain-containing protein [Streptococcus didelphis]
MGKFLKTLVIGTATGFATAYFLSSEKGKALKLRAEKAFEAYKENPEEYHQMAKDKGYEYGNLAKETFYDYKQKFETGQLKPEDIFETVKEKASDFVQKAGQPFSDMESDRQSQSESDVEVPLADSDIIIDYSEIPSESLKPEKPLPPHHHPAPPSPLDVEPIEEASKHLKPTENPDSDKL